MRGRRLSQGLIHFSLIVLLAPTLYPVFFMLATSLKTNRQFYKSFWGFSWPLVFSNYSVAWDGVHQYVLNSILVTVLSVAGIVVVSVLSAYVFARFSFPLKNLLFYGILALLMVPALLTLVPLFLEVKTFGLLNTYWALILPYMAGGQVLGIFILRAFFESLPKELFEAARIDGAREITILFRVAIPLSYAPIGAVAILNALNVWNDFLWPMVVLPDQSKWTIPLGLMNLQGQYVLREIWGPLFAAYVIASLPIVILFALTMKTFIKGLTAGAVKM